MASKVQGWIENAAYKSARTWSAQGAIVKWGTGADNADANDFPLVMLNLTVSFGRTLQKFFPIAQVEGQSTQINIGGAPRGTMQVGAIFAPYNDQLVTFLNAVGKECKNRSEGVNVSIMPFGNQTCSGDSEESPGFNNQVKFTLKNVELETLGVTIQGGEVAIVNFPTTYSFTGLGLEI